MVKVLYSIRSNILWGTSQAGGGLSIGEINGYHAKGSVTTFSGSVDSAYDAGSCGITFNYINAKVVYS